MLDSTKIALAKRATDLLEKLCAGGLLVAFLQKEGALYGAIIGGLCALGTFSLTYALNEHFKERK